MNPNTFCVYIITNAQHSVFYTSVTNDLPQHMVGLREGRSSFAKKYKLAKLVYFEFKEDMKDALARVKQIRASSRPKKIEVITAQNPNWKDLFDELSN
ncbi:MAG: hypothetical protein JNL09_10315 [Anaerolineales bacterium]|nr:hypothetical protein [Anaerolineales bacterium]